MNNSYLSLANYRDPALVHGLMAEIQHVVTRQWSIMEICGGQTHAILQHGLDGLLPPEIELVHGPGCPVCVTPLELIDKAQLVASHDNVIFCSFGDMLRVPGSHGDLFSIRSSGGDVRVVYSPLDTIKIAIENPKKEVVFFAIGFETTAPANISLVLQAESLGLQNLSILVSQVRVPPAMHSILGSPENRVQGFLAAGHVCAVMGYWEYPPIAASYKVPMAVTGFEPVDLLQGILMVVKQLEDGTSTVENAYPRVVSFKGNEIAQEMIARVYQSMDMNWRGIGIIPQSGWELRSEYDRYKAEQKFDLSGIHTLESKECIAGKVLQGICKPADCPAFAKKCTPQNPLGAPMVSSEGTCNAYYRYHH